MQVPGHQDPIDEVLRWRAARHASRTAVIHLVDGETLTEERTYADLDHSARRIAAWLQARCVIADRVLLVLPAGLEVIEAFFGCLYAGVTPVLAYPPRRRGSLEQLGRIARDSGARLVLSTPELIGGVADGGTTGDFVDCRWHAVAEAADDATAWRPVPPDPARLAFLQYTSGSTGAPKGVEVTHANLIANQAAIGRIFRQRPDEMVMAGWLPMYHDMGLVGNLLHPLHLGGTLVFMAPIAFLQRPARWLQMISRYRATISGGPNFAYDLCVSRISDAERATLDLRSWEVAFNGAEPVRAATLKRFAAAFRPCGFDPAAFCPCYGMAETTLLVSGSSPGEPWTAFTADAAALERHRLVAVPSGGTGVRVVGCGVADESYAVRIVAPETAAPLPDGHVGEIWLAGPSVARGYWGATDLTAERFRARVADPADDRLYLRTGDLGGLIDGRLHITGRLKDVVIVNGANHYPQDLECCAEASHPDLMPGACVAWGEAGDDTDRVMIACEVARGAWRGFDLESIVAAVCTAIREAHDLAVDRFLLVRPGGIPKTTSGKLQRSLTRRMAAEGTLPVLASWERPRAVAAPPAGVPDGADLRHWLRARIAQLTGTSPDQVSIHQPLAMVGMTSIATVQLAAELGVKLGRHVPPTLAYDHPTIDALSRALAGVPTGAATADPGAAPVTAADPIAVISLACRFPGAATPAALWHLLRAGGSAIAPLPADRPTTAADAVPPAGYLDRIDLFDPLFFGISPREADEIDPQHRLVLEVAWEAFENAGLTLPRLAAIRTGVFIGCGPGEYARLMARSGHVADGHLAVGNAPAMAANRLSYLCNLRGPSLTIDTACSSSLVAVHVAAESLRRDECDLAVAGGVNVICGTELSAALARAGMLSPGGSSRAFADGADGYVRGEGCGVVLLKRLADARRDGDPVVAVLRGTAVNQDGRSNGLTAPNGLAQQAVIRTALARSGLEPGDIDVIEAHGTGTELGDPIEMSALTAVFAPRTVPLRVASVKNAIGHLEAAAGIAGLVKVCLALRHGLHPVHRHADRPSPHIDWQPGFELPRDEAPWPADTGRVRRAGVSSFGFGGTNAHVVVEEPPAPAPAPPRRPATGAWLPLSAKTAAALRALAARYAAALADGELAASDLDDVVATAALGRSEFTCRAAFPAESRTALVRHLRQFAADEGAAAGHATWARGDADEPPRWVWVFPASPGADVDVRAAALSRAFPEFAEAHARLLEQAGDAATDEARAVAFQCVLATWWRRLGAEPAATIGQGAGVFAAAVTAGAITFAEALDLTSHVAAVRHASTGEPRADAARRLAAVAARITVGDTPLPWLAAGLGRPRTGDDWLRLATPAWPGDVAPAMHLVFGDTDAIPAGMTALPASGSTSATLAAFWDTVARAFVAGCAFEWPLLVGDRPRVTGLPTYPFDRRSCWFRHEAHPADPLPGRRLDVSGAVAVYETDLARCPTLADHRVRGAAVLPTTAVLELVNGAAHDAGLGRMIVENLLLEEALTWRSGEPTRVQTAIVAIDAGVDGRERWRCDVSVRRESGWKRCATCRLVRAADVAEAGAGVPEPWHPAGEVVDVESHYARCAAVGLEYGGEFRCVTTLRCRDREAWAEVAIDHAGHAGADAPPPGPTQRAVLLDGCLQAIAAIPQVPHRLWLPVGIDRYRLDRTPPSTGVRVHARLVDQSERGELRCDLVFVAADDSRCGAIEGLRLASAAADGRAGAGAELHWAEVWEPRTRATPGDSPPELPADRLASLLGERPACGIGAALLDAESRRDLENVAAAFATNALCELVGAVPAGTLLVESEVAAHATVSPARRPLLRRVLQIAAAAGWLRSAPAGWVVERDLAMQDALAAGSRALAAQPELAPELRLLMRCGPHVSAVLRGAVDPLGLLFPGRGVTPAADVYTLSVGARRLNELVAEAVSRLGAALPAGRALRILEIGGGTAATTRAILGRVPAWRVDYTFTDVGQSFLAAAAEEFSGLPAFATRRLDIESDPAAQGFAAGSWDVVVAANVLHATVDVRDSLGHVRSLLAPGGTLLLVEGTHPVAWMDLTFGLTDGWWRCRERNDFRDHPLLDPDGWRNCLERAGFPRFTALGPGRAPPDRAENMLGIATADSGPRPAPVVPRPVLVLGVNMPPDEGLTAALRRRGLPAENRDVPRRPDAAWSRALAESIATRHPAHVVVVAGAEAVANVADTAVDLLDAIRVVVQSYLGAATAPLPALTLVTSGAHGLPGDRAVNPPHAAAHGLIRSVTLERTECPVRSIDVDPDGSVDWDAVVAEILDDGPEREVAFRGDTRLVRRLRPHRVLDGGPANRRLEIRQRGAIDGLRLGTVARRPPGPYDVEIAVEAAGLNFRDLLNVLGRYPEDVPLGAECAGTVTRVGAAVVTRVPGERVVAVTPDSCADFVTVPESLVVPLPAGLDAADAAGLPVAWLTAAVALDDLARLRSGQRILIHAASGGVGLAAVGIARERGAHILASAGIAKHVHLLARGIGDVFDSRSPGFAAEILGRTAGAGVDVVLNTLDESLVAENLAVLARGGTYVDITKPSAVVAARVAAERPDVSYHCFDLAAMLRESPAPLAARLRRLLDDVAAGQLPRLPVRSYPLRDHARAFRTLQRAEHVGKLVLRPDPLPPGLAAARTVTVRSDGAYVVTGGTGDLGRLTAGLLAARGAGLVALVARRPPDARQRRAIDELVAGGGRIEVFVADVADRRALDDVLATIRRRLPIVGVIHAAGVLADGLIEEQSRERFETVLAPKVRGAWNLHDLTRDDRLDMFVLYSSLAAVLGAPGQANHAAASGFLDGLAAHRLAAGLPATCLDFGPWADIGAAARRDVGARADLRGIGMLSVPAGTEALGRALAMSDARYVVAPIVATEVPARLRDAGLFDLGRTPGADRVAGGDLRGRLREVPAARAAAWVRERVMETLGRILGLGDPTRVRPNAAFVDLGLDSLTGIEFVDALNRDWGAAWPASIVYDHPSVAALATFIVAATGPAREEALEEAPEDAPEEAVAEAVTPADGTATDVDGALAHLLVELDRWNR